MNFPPGGDNLVIAAVDFQPQMDENEVPEAKLWDADGHHKSSTERPSGAQLAANLNFDFPQLVRQHNLGAVGYIVWVLFTIYSCFRRWKNFENR